MVAIALRGKVAFCGSEELAALAATMNLKALKMPLLLELAKGLGLDIQKKIRKADIIEDIEKLEAGDDELSDCLKLILENEKYKRESRRKKMRNAWLKRIGHWKRSFR